MIIAENMQWYCDVFQSPQLMVFRALRFAVPRRAGYIYNIHARKGVYLQHSCEERGSTTGGLMVRGDNEMRNDIVNIARVAEGL